MGSLTILFFISLAVEAIFALCPKFGALPQFELEGLKKERYLGRWFQQEAHNTITNRSGKCWSQLYARKSPENPYELEVTTDYVSTLTDSAKVETADVLISNQDDPNLLAFATTLFTRNYRVVATDYDNFAIEYTCQDSALLKRNENIWIMTRERFPSRRVMRKAFKALKRLELSPKRLVPTDQDCDDSLLSKPTTPKRKDKKDRKDGEESPTIKTGDLISSLGGSFLRITQTIFAPWTLPGERFSVHGTRPKSEKRKQGKKTGRRKRRLRNRGTS